jgi:hypothetical protein
LPVVLLRVTGTGQGVEQIARTRSSESFSSAEKRSLEPDMINFCTLKAI